MPPRASFGDVVASQVKHMVSQPVRAMGLGKKNGFKAALDISPELKAFLGREKVSRPMLTKLMWAYFKQHKLMDPSDKRFVKCDDKLRALTGEDRFQAFSFMKLLNKHIIKGDGGGKAEEDDEEEMEAAPEGAVEEAAEEPAAKAEDAQPAEAEPAAAAAAEEPAKPAEEPAAAPEEPAAAAPAEPAAEEAKPAEAAAEEAKPAEAAVEPAAA